MSINIFEVLYSIYIYGRLEIINTTGYTEKRKFQFRNNDTHKPTKDNDPERY